MNAAAPLVRRLMTQALRRAFRRVAWVGAAPALAAGRPTVLYANHHNFYDGYLLWLVAHRMLGRPTLTWMADWDRFPFFGAVGALPFPPDDARRRAATLRETARRFRQSPETVLVYFPEGRLHRAEEGLLPFDTAFLARLHRILAPVQWWPVGIHPTWDGAALPTALVGGGAPHEAPDGAEPNRLADVWQAVRTADPEAAQTLLDGRAGPDEAWNFSALRRFFDPYA